MTDKEYILELEKRIIKLEEKINNICIKEDGNVQFQTSQIATVILGENCKMEFTNCPVGMVCNNIQDAEERLEDIEMRLEAINEQIDDIEDEVDN